MSARALSAPDRGDAAAAFAALETLPIPILQVDGEQVRLNAAAGQMIGRPPAAVATLAQWFVATAGDDAAQARRLYELDRRLGRPRPRLMPLRRDDGVARMVELTVYDQGGAQLWFMNDISDQIDAEAALHASAESARRTLEALPAIAFRLRAGGGRPVRLTFIGNRVEEWHGWSSADLIGVPERLFDAVLPDDRDRIARRLATALARHLPFRIDYRIAWGRSWRWLRASARPQPRPDGTTVWGGLIADIDDLRRAADDSRRANRAKSEFLSRMSHELRTPLNAILGFNQLLEKLEPNERQHRYITYIEQAGQHLLKLVNEVLELSKIEAGAMSIDLGPVDLAHVLPEVVALMAPAAARNGISIVAPQAALPVVRADRTRLRQVLLNFVSNAVKYNRPNGRITLSVRRPQAGICRIAVADTGPGIPLERQRDLFVAFNRLDAEGSTVEGTGIGLVITKRLINLMQGEIGFESSAEGSTFWVDLPMVGDFAGGADRKPAGARTRAVDNIAHLLVIAHDAARLEHLREVLVDAADIVLTSAPHVDIAADLARHRRIDLILIDPRPPQPGLDELRRRLAGRPETTGIPLLVMTDAADPGAAQLRGIDTIAEPFRRGDLTARINSLIAFRGR